MAGQKKNLFDKPSGAEFLLGGLRECRGFIVDRLPSPERIPKGHHKRVGISLLAEPTPALAGNPVASPRAS